MDIKDFAAKLDGSEYREEGSRELFAQMHGFGFVAVFGASDDLMEFRGGIDAEAGAGTVAIGGKGLLTSDCDEGEECPYFKKLAASAPKITAHFDREGFTFVYETTIPHATFVVNEDGEPYCRGIVFDLANLGAV
jgi:hypothetical protein